jgi:hypothetical protein
MDIGAGAGAGADADARVPVPCALAITVPRARAAAAPATPSLLIPFFIDVTPFWSVGDRRPDRMQLASAGYS